MFNDLFKKCLYSKVVEEFTIIIFKVNVMSFQLHFRILLFFVHKLYIIEKIKNV